MDPPSQEPPAKPQKSREDILRDMPLEIQLKYYQNTRENRKSEDTNGYATLLLERISAYAPYIFEGSAKGCLDEYLQDPSIRELPDALERLAEALKPTVRARAASGNYPAIKQTLEFFQKKEIPQVNAAIREIMKGEYSAFVETGYVVCAAPVGIALGIIDVNIISAAFEMLKDCYPDAAYEIGKDHLPKETLTPVATKIFQIGLWRINPEMGNYQKVFDSVSGEIQPEIIQSEARTLLDAIMARQMPHGYPLNSRVLINSLELCHLAKLPEECTAKAVKAAISAFHPAARQGFTTGYREGIDALVYTAKLCTELGLSGLRTEAIGAGISFILRNYYCENLGYRTDSANQSYLADAKQLLNEYPVPAPVMQENIMEAINGRVSAASDPVYCKRPFNELSVPVPEALVDMFLPALSSAITRWDQKRAEQIINILEMDKYESARPYIEIYKGLWKDYQTLYPPPHNTPKSKASEPSKLSRLSRLGSWINGWVEEHF